MVSSVKLAELWQRLGYRVVAVCMGARTECNKVSETLTIYAVKDMFIPDPFNYGIAPSFFKQVSKACKTEKPDIIVVNKILYWSTISLLLLRLQGKKVILITDVLLGMTWWPRSIVAKLCGALYAWTLGWLLLLAASRVVFFHPQPDGLLRVLGVRGKSQVIPTGIDESEYRKGTRGTDDNVTVTYVGRLESIKGVDDFLAAVDPLLSKHSSLTVRVVGWYKRDHPLVARYRDRITFTGLRSDIPDILADSDIFVLPSHSEGLSNALMEAMSSSCACIASAVGGNRFLIEHEVSGLLYPAGDRDALRERLVTLISDASQRDRLGRAARERIEHTFSWNTVGGQYARLFSEHA